MADETKSLVDYVIDKSPLDFAKEFDDRMRDLVSDLVDMKRTDIAKDIFTGESKPLEEKHTDFQLRQAAKYHDASASEKWELLRNKRLPPDEESAKKLYHQMDRHEKARRTARNMMYDRQDKKENK